MDGGKSMKVWVDVTLAVSVWSIVENGAFWLNRGSPPSPLSPALLHLHWMRESLPFSPSQIVQTEDISDSTQFITFLPAFQTNTHTKWVLPASDSQKNLKILYMQLIWKLTQLTMKYFVSLTCKASWEKITWFFLLKTCLHILHRHSKFAKRHCSMAHREVLIGTKVEICKREKPLIYLTEGWLEIHS